jgi:hypothetical protein
LGTSNQIAQVPEGWPHQANGQQGEPSHHKKQGEDFLKLANYDRYFCLHSREQIFFHSLAAQFPEKFAKLSICLIHIIVQQTSQPSRHNPLQ